MGEETKVEKMFMTLEDGSEVVLNEIKDIQFTESEDDDIVVPREFLADREISFTAEVKWPKFFRCKNRKRYKKLLMSLGVGRNYADWLIEGFVVRKEIWPKEDDFSYQELWNEVRINTLGI